MVTAKIIGVEDSVEVVAFVLENHCRESFDVFCRVTHGFDRGVGDVDVLISLDIPALSRNA